jgi:hypothetical protein
VGVFQRDSAALCPRLGAEIQGAREMMQPIVTIEEGRA